LWLPALGRPNPVDAILRDYKRMARIVWVQDEPAASSAP